MDLQNNTENHAIEEIKEKIELLNKRMDNLEGEVYAILKKVDALCDEVKCNFQSK